MSDLKPHPLAEFNPDQSAEEYSSLKQSIALTGVHDRSCSTRTGCSMAVTG